MSKQSAAPRIAMIGCGAIAERYHLPCLGKIPGVLENVVLVDRSSERTQLMAKMFGISRQATDVTQVLSEIDGAIVAVPPALHHPICIELLTAGVPVLCEKPLAESPVNAREMVGLAKARNVALCVNHSRRMLPAYAEIKRLIDSDAIGNLVEIRWEEGCEFDWPAATAFQFRGGAHGVLLDTGIHSLDLFCWWLGCKPEVVTAQTDSFGGPEALAEIELQSGQCRIRQQLSWLSRLSNSYRIVGERGTISGILDYFDRITLTSPDGRRQERRLRAAERTYNEFGHRIVANFIDVVAGRAEPLVSAESVLPAIEVMDECYESATRLEMPWLTSEESVCNASA
ncbi:MAG TPA: Gfo/Idh/MocA family oxidoreductase [Lacipirellulaceae bacterium]|nr:Gfo/Idh/MocA family oxidoreductase [Lacipirellulaceae bacterium]